MFTIFSLTGIFNFLSLIEFQRSHSTHVFSPKNLQHFPARHVKANCNSPTFCSDCSSLSIRIERFRLIEAARRRRWRIVLVATWEKLHTFFSLLYQNPLQCVRKSRKSARGKFNRRQMHIRDDDQIELTIHSRVWEGKKTLYSRSSPCGTAAAAATSCVLCLQSTERN